MRNTFLALLVSLAMGASTGCHCLDGGSFRRPRACCDSGCGLCKTGLCEPRACGAGGCGEPRLLGGGIPGVRALGKLAQMHADKRSMGPPPGMVSTPHGELGNPGPPMGTVTYPYYTVRAPRDFLARNPPGIGR